MQSKILQEAGSGSNELRPLEYFKSYMQYGYYPYFLENTATYSQKLAETVSLALNIDLPTMYDISFASTEKIRLLLHIISKSVPFKPNITKLSERTGTTRNSLIAFLKYLQEMRMVRGLYCSTQGIGALQKPEKLFLHHPNLHFALSDDQGNTGNIRESFFVNQTSAKYPVTYAKQGDFAINNYYFEVGGKSKTMKQIKNLNSAYIAADDIEIGHQQKIPLWLFGFLY